MLEPGLLQQGLEQLDVQSMLESVDSLDELQQALNVFESFLKKMLAGTCG